MTARGAGPPTPPGLVERVAELAARVAADSSDQAIATDLERLQRRLREPLRIAIAGRVKAGKSTLLNALVGQRLAPTDAGECTRVISWYRHGLDYDVTAVLAAGGRRTLAFTREDGALQIDLGGLDPDAIDRFEIGWPSGRLEAMTLIDTPGIGSIHTAVSDRTHVFFSGDAVRDDADDGDAQAPPADAVIYLMRHMHRRDHEFLEAFTDPLSGEAIAADAIAVLSRADEIGAGRLDALESARRIATRYAEDERVRVLASRVLPVAGLLAETGQTLREDEAAAIRTLAGQPREKLERLVLSVEHFSDPDVDALPEAVRRGLLDRFGLFGVRYAVNEFLTGRVDSGPALARSLIHVSGLEELRRVIDRELAPRAQALQARSGLAALRAVARRLAVGDPGAARALAGDVERIEAGAPELARLRLVQLVRAGVGSIAADDVAEIERVVAPVGVAERLGIAPDEPPEAQQARALEGVQRWRVRAANPLADRAATEIAESVAREYEGLYVETGGGTG